MVFYSVIIVGVVFFFYLKSLGHAVHARRYDCVLKYYRIKEKNCNYNKGFLDK